VSIPVGASTLTTTAFGNAKTVAVGTTVAWTNTDLVAHTATANGGAFDSGAIEPGRSFSVVLSTPGTITYHCSIHPNMVGTITVQ
jgi:plastocyanin